MKKIVLYLVVTLTGSWSLLAQSPVLGGYPYTSIPTAGGNATVSPSGVPLNAVGIHASTSPNFKGLITVSPVTGIVTITNAWPAGIYTVKLTAFNGAGIAVTSFTLNAGNADCSQGRFYAAPIANIADRPSALIVADFNNDGIQDIASAGLIINKVNIRLGDGAGSFTGNNSFTIGSNKPTSLVACDFNGDGKADLAVTDANANNVSIATGDGTGNFTVIGTFNAGPQPQGIAAGDFNGDGKPDLVISSYTKLTVRLGDGAGAFTAAPDVIAGAQPYSIATGDFNGDNNLDFVCTNYGTNTVSVRLGNGSGGFTASADVTVGYSPRGIITGDFNTDGKTDLAVLSLNNNYVSIRMGDGAGNFTASSNISFFSDYTSSFVSGDFNGDGKIDLAVGSNIKYEIIMRMGNGAGAFSDTSLVTFPFTPSSLSTGDFNNDGKQDIIESSTAMTDVAVQLGGANEISIQGNNVDINSGDLSPDPADNTDFGTGGTLSRAFTIRNQGITPLKVTGISLGGPDASFFSYSGISFPATIVAGGSRTFSIALLPNNTAPRNATVTISNDDCDEALYNFAVKGTGIIPSLGTYPTTTLNVASGNTTVATSVLPVNVTSISATTTPGFKGSLEVNPATGKVTIINAHPAGVYNIKIRAFNGPASATTDFSLIVNNTACSQGSFTAGANVALGGTPSNTGIADFNNDGKQDFVATNEGSRTISLRLGNGTGGFTGTTNISTAENLNALSIADFNNDGNMDLATANYVASTVTLRLGNGSGAFSESQVTVGTNPYCLAKGDFNNDGKPDLVTGNASSVSILLGNGTGGFISISNLVVAVNSWRCVSVSDFNGDGNDDLAMANTNSRVFIFLGNGLGGFDVATQLAASDIWSIEINDFDSDGIQDLALVPQSSSSNYITIHIGNGGGGFSTGTGFTIGANPRRAVSGDFNGDGKQDLAITSGNTNTISVLLGKGDGTFVAGNPIPAGTNPVALAVGDFNADGRQDLVCVNSTSNNASVHLNNLNGISVKGKGVSIADGDTTTSAGNLTDFGNGGTVVNTYKISNPGLVKLAISNIAVAGPDSAVFKVTPITFPAFVLPGDSLSFTITFKPTSSGVKNATVNIANDNCVSSIYDFAVRGIGLPKPVIGVYTATTIAAASGNTIVQASSPPNNHVGVFASTSQHFKGTITVDSLTGRVKIANAYPAGVYTVTVRATNGFYDTTSTFTLTVNNPKCSQGRLDTSHLVNLLFGQAYMAVVGDFNNDNVQDIIFLSDYSNVPVMLGKTSGGFTESQNVYLGNNPNTIALADINGDGNSDILGLNAAASTVSIRMGDGAGHFTGYLTINLGVAPQAIVFGDINKDGRADMVFITNTNTMFTKLGDGTGNFTNAVNMGFVNATGLVKMELSDINGDNNADLVTASLQINSVSVRYGNGQGQFSGSTVIGVIKNPSDLVIADFNNDGKRDFALTHTVDSCVSVKLGDGNGGFTAVANVPLPPNPVALTAGDFNGDGNIDIATVSNPEYFTHYMVISLGNGKGGFAPAFKYRLNNAPRYLVVGDFNSDGRQDIVPMGTENFSASSAAVFMGDSSTAAINVKGNNIAIQNGDLTPATTDSTDFGSLATGQTRTVKYTISNSGSGYLKINSITTTGVDSLLFTKAGIALPVAISPKDSTSFVINFAPVSPGLKTAVVKIQNDDCDDAVYSFSIQGTARTAGAALHFDGIDDYITINDTTGNIDTGRTTISAWIKTTATAPSTILSKRNNCILGSFFDFGLTSSGRLTVELKDTGVLSQAATGNIAVNDGSWHQVAAVRKDSVLSLYVDGVLDTSFTASGIATVRNNAVLTIGASGCNGSSNFFSGEIDDLRFWGKALSKASIQNSRNCELNTSQAGLLAYYKFNQGLALDDNSSINTAADSSTNNKTGILHNFALNGAASNWTAAGAFPTGTTCNFINTWLGASPDWSLASNWSAGRVPFEETIVVINNAVPFMPQVTDPESTCFSLTIANGATLIVKGSGRLNITGKH